MGIYLDLKVHFHYTYNQGFETWIGPYGSNQKNLEPLIFVILLASRTVLWEKRRDPCKPWSNLKVLRTVTRPLLTVPYFPLYLNLKIKKIKKATKWIF